MEWKQYFKNEIIKIIRQFFDMLSFSPTLCSSIKAELLEGLNMPQ